jgi:hypothetical protein
MPPLAGFFFGPDSSVKNKLTRTELYSPSHLQDFAAALDSADIPLTFSFAGYLGRRPPYRRTGREQALNQ